MQGDYQALFEKYGSVPYKKLRAFLRAGLIDVLASDTHKVSDEYRLAGAYQAVYRVLRDRSAVLRLFEENPQRMLENKEI